MFSKYYSITLCFFFLGACCKESFPDLDEIEVKPLTEEAKLFMPYTVGESIRFVHSNGFEAGFEVVSSGIDIEYIDENYHCGGTSVGYEQAKASLASKDLELSIMMRVELIQDYALQDYPFVYVYMNGYSFASPQSDTSFQYQDLTVNGVLFDSAYALEPLVVSTQTAASPHRIQPSRIWCTKNEGIIKIELSNEDFFAFSK